MDMHFIRGLSYVRPLGTLISLFVFAIGMAMAQGDPTATSPSPVLLNLVRETLNKNPGVQAARAAVAAAEARVRGADRPLYNPQLELGAEQAETRTGSLGLSQAIDWADKRGARTDVADAELGAVRAEYATVRQRLGGELLTSLGRYHTAQSMQQLAQQRAELMRRFLNLAEKRNQAGDLSQIELNLARLARTQAILQLSQTASDLAATGQALAAVTGELRRDWPALPTDLPELQVIDAESILTNLPELRASRARTRAARSAVTLRTRERRPDPTIGVRAGQERSFRNGNNDAYGMAGLTLSIPLYVRNSFRAEVEVAGAELTQAEQSLQDRYRRARARLLLAADRYRLSRSAWGAWLRTGQSSLGDQVLLLERIWRSGEMSTADYLMQLNQTLDVRINALDVQGRLWMAWADWLVASGQLDAWLGQVQQR
ncbi:MAG: hypothetical protein BMS9Abin26_0064 [Gammaproteobacteria bacterium]|nr:MAG: hypothetical protein BMS9Abin26_0064 [Gammaproteobacteria bacterium]